jgi:peptide deformylase
MPDETKILPLRYWDDPVLSAVCDKIEDSEFGPELEEFGRQLVATMEAKNGIGLAAPQVGVAKRVFAMHFPDWMEDRDYGVSPKSPIVVCNPTLVLTGRAVAGREGCLSLPGVWEQVYRSGGAVMQFCHTNGRAEEVVLEGMNARVAQHEYDHTCGIMFFDWKDKRPQPWGARMSKQLSKGVLREWEKVRNGNH